MAKKIEVVPVNDFLLVLCQLCFDAFSQRERQSRPIFVETNSLVKRRCIAPKYIAMAKAYNQLQYPFCLLGK
jgi:hypothetical protein